MGFDVACGYHASHQSDRTSANVRITRVHTQGVQSIPSKRKLALSVNGRINLMQEALCDGEESCIDLAGIRFAPLAS